MTTGIIIVSFGEQYDLIAAHCVAYSRRFTSLPISVVTNVENRCESWPDTISFIYLPIPTSFNRIIKTTIINYSPYDNTILLDADAIIQRHGFDQIIGMFGSKSSLILNHFCDYPKEGSFQNIYLRACSQFDCGNKLRVYNGAVIGFTKSSIAKQFFNKWNEFYIRFGAAREMPPLACAVKKTLLDRDIKLLPENFFAGDFYNKSAIVQHNYNKDFWHRIGLLPQGLNHTGINHGDYEFTKMQC